MSSVYANDRVILHRGDGLTQVSGPPDVCKTPSPAGPVPIPYPNVAQDSHLADGAKTVAIEGSPVALASSNLATSSGDEPGTAGGGIISSKIKGKLTFGSSSIDVQVEGKGVVRFMDVTQHNGNTFNTVLVASGDVAYGDDPLDQDDCAICGEPKSAHKIVPADDIRQKATALAEALVDPRKPFRQCFVRPNGQPLKPGVMIGVLSCQCEERRQYAGLAGPAYVDGNYRAGADAFENEASSLALTPVVNPPTPPPASGFHPPAGATPGFGSITMAQYNAALARQQTLPPDRQGRGNAPLSCAAPKMIQKCLADGHKPGTIIEIWVALKQDSQVTIPHVFGLAPDTSTSPPGTKMVQHSERKFGDGEVVPSCLTCQVLCTGMLCYTGKPPCP